MDKDKNKNKFLLDLLCKIDQGYQPMNDELKMLNETKELYLSIYDLC